VLRESLTSGGWDQQFERVLWETERVEDAMERTYMKEPFNMDVLSERNYGSDRLRNGPGVGALRRGGT